MNTDTLEKLENSLLALSILIFFLTSPDIKAQYYLFEVGLLLSFSIIILQFPLRKEYTRINTFSFTISKTRINIHKTHGFASAMLAGSIMAHEINTQNINFIYNIMFVISQLFIAKFEIKKS